MLQQDIMRFLWQQSVPALGGCCITGVFSMSDELLLAVLGPPLVNGLHQAGVIMFAFIGCWCMPPCRFAGGFISTGAIGAATERQVCRRRACGARRSAARAAQGAAAAGATAEATMLEPNVRNVDAAGCDWVPAGATDDAMSARTE